MNVNVFEVAELRAALNATGRSDWTTGRLPAPDGVLAAFPPNYPPFGFIYVKSERLWVVGMLTVDFDGLPRGEKAVDESELDGKHKTLTDALDAVGRFIEAGGTLRPPTGVGP